MAKKEKGPTEFEQRFRALEAWFEAQGLPVFLLGWQKETVDTNDGYLYGYVSPADVGMQVKKDNRFPRLLGGILGFDREKYQ